MFHFCSADTRRYVARLVEVVRRTGPVTAARRLPVRLLSVRLLSAGIVMAVLAAGPMGGVSVAWEAAESGAGPDEPAAAQALFDGKSFAGWEGNLDYFRIQDGAIVAGKLTADIPRNEFLCTQKQYGDFELRLKVKVVGAGANAGIQFRSQRIPNHHEVRGYQADVGQNWWGKLYDESRRNRVLAQPADAEAFAQVLRPDDWNDYVIRCQGPRIQLWVNGFQTVDYTEADPQIPRRGILGLQIHGGPPSEAWYKDITIRVLDEQR